MSNVIKIRHKKRPPKPKPTRNNFGPRNIGILVALVVAGAAGYFWLYPQTSTSNSINVQFRFCSSSPRINCVVDGDTIHALGVKIRIEDIDTPEKRGFRCPRELELARRASARLLELLNMGPFDIVYTGGRDEDIYGRKLRMIKRNGQSLGDILVSEGLAHVWDGAKHSWCN